MPLRFLHRVMFEVRTFLEQVLLLLQQHISNQLLQNIFSGGDLPDGFLLKQCEGHQRFFWDIDLRPQILAMLTENNSDALSLIVDEADRVYAHIFDLLGSGPVYLGEKIDWHMDFKVGHHWNPRTYYKRIRPAPYPGGYDIKVPWELSRCQHFARLGQAYWITENEKYAQEFVSQVEDWIASNPWPWGVNWACTMDVAIRVVNWLWGYYFFKDSPTLHDEFRLAFFKSLLVHGRHIWRNLENQGDFTGNHYIADLVGLIYLGMLCPEFKEARRWREFGLQELEKEMFKQVYPDGVDFEASTSYHRLVTEMFLSATILAQLNGYKFSQPFMERLEKMVEFVMYLTKPDGTAPLIGDNDNGRLHRLKAWDPPVREWVDFRYLLAIGAVLFEREDFAQAAGDQWEEAVWLLGKDAIEFRRSVRNKHSSLLRLNSRGFEDAGIYIMRDDDLYMVVDAGLIGQDSHGGHAHNDALSFEFYVNGVSWIVDPGTYVYTMDYEARDLFRSTIYHNTPVVILPRALEQNRSDPRVPFSLCPDVECHAKWEENDSYYLLSLCLTHYADMDIALSRAILVAKNNNLVIIRDRFFGNEKCGFCSNLHLIDLPVRKVEDHASRYLLGLDNKWICIECVGQHSTSSSISHAWLSPSYGVRYDAPVLRYEVKPEASHVSITLCIYYPQAASEYQPFQFAQISAAVAYLDSIAPLDL